MDILIDVKHYPRSEAEKIARQIFDNVEADRGHGNRSVEWFLEKIIPYEDYIAEYERR